MFTLSEKLYSDLNLTPVVASEIEFYLFGADTHEDPDIFWQALRAQCEAENIVLEKIEKERAEEQFEISLPPLKDAALMAQKTIRLKELITGVADAHRIEASFAAKPREGQPGSGLHIHIHLEDANGRNVYFKNDERMSDPLRYSLGGLLATMQEYMKVFAPVEDSYGRFVPGYNAPTTVSWGANNRTTALRLPDKASHIKHIEHRVAGADADPAAVIEAILHGLHHGLVNRIEPGAQVYGDASLQMYGLAKLY